MWLDYEKQQIPSGADVLSSSELIGLVFPHIIYQ
jgi:hypothetical protein